MAGVTRHIFECEIRDILEMWDKQIRTIKNILPQYYTKDDINSLLKYYYPHEWRSVEIKYEYYRKKDYFLKRRFGKSRYNMKKPEELIKSVSAYQQILSIKTRETYANNYIEKSIAEGKAVLWKKRKPKIDKINHKIEKSLSRVQQVTPVYIDQLIGYYERKNASQKDRMYILLELQKYYSPKIIQFFFKLNDTELNKQLRWIAFYHLQSFNYQPRARRQKYMQIHTNNKRRKKYLKEVYPNERYTIPKNPYELEYRIENAKEQKIKEFDYFISHSSRDSKMVQKLITYENRIGKNIFCDWINDADYLKRHLLCEATLNVIEKRLEQSKALIFVESNNSISSVWCKYELNYFLQFKRPMYFIKKIDIENGNFNLKKFLNKWFMDPKYKELALLEGTKIK